MCIYIVLLYNTIIYAIIILFTTNNLLFTIYSFYLLLPICYTILYYTILYYTILYYTILYYTISHMMLDQDVELVVSVPPEQLRQKLLGKLEKKLDKQLEKALRKRLENRLETSSRSRF